MPTAGAAMLGVYAELMVRTVVSATMPLAVADPDPQGVLRGRLYLLLLVALSIISVGTLFVVMLLRRMRVWRSKAEREIRPVDPRDPWVEAGKRAEPATRYLSASGDVGMAGESSEAQQPRADAMPVRNPQNWPSGTRPVVVITGGIRRVGRAIAETFAKSGYDLVLTYHTSHESARQAADELCQLGVAVHLVALDLDDLAVVDRVGAELAHALPRVDVLVHNASIYGETTLENVTPGDAMAYYRVNAAAPLILSKRLASKLASSDRPGGGAIVAMSDIHAIGRPRRGFVAYSMSKAALTEMVRSLARDMAPHVRVNAVAPGVVAWPDAGADSSSAEQESYLKRVPMGRSGTPIEAAEAVRWLANDARYTTGQIIRIDGGRFLT